MCKSISRICNKILLPSAMCVFILQESSSEIRDALRSLLCSCQITTRGGLNSTVHSLLENLKKYPTDKQSIWRYRHTYIHIYIHTCMYLTYIVLAYKCMFVVQVNCDL